MGWDQFEKLGTSFLYAKGVKDIKSAGGTKDGGKDAAVFLGGDGTIIVQISQEKEPLKVVTVKAQRKSKFWREYDKWKDNEKVKQFIFVSSQPLGNQKIKLMQDLKSPPVDIYGLDDLVNFLDYDDNGKEMKKQYAIFDKDLHEVFGADNQNEKLNSVAKVINNDTHYHVTTVLSPSEQMITPAGTVFSMQEGDVIKYFIPKSLEDYQQAIPVGNVTITGTKAEVDQHLKAIRTGVGTTIPNELISNYVLRVGDRVIADGSKGMPSITVGAVPDRKPRIIILRSVSDPTNEVRSTLHVTERTLDEIIMNNHDKNEPLDFEVRATAERKLTANFKFQLERCRDAVVAYKYARIYNALHSEELELLVDDDGIERPIARVAKNEGLPLDADYMEVLHKLARIQQFYKVRLPNALAESVVLKKSDARNAELLVKVIDEGKADINGLNSLSFTLMYENNDELLKATDREIMLAFGDMQKLQFLSVLGVNNFPMLQLILPKAKIEATQLKDGESKLEVAILEKPYLRLFTGDSQPPAATWESAVS